LNKRYSLPDQYFISVGSIIERKNLLKVFSAFSKLDNNNIGLVVVGKGSEYKQKVVDLIKKEGIEHQVIFLEDHFSSADIFRDLPLLYQRSMGLIYPSQMEGFGIPIVEAFSSSIPVITSNCSSMQEIGQGAALLIDPLDEAQYIDAFQTILGNDSDRNQLIQKGTEALSKFTTEQFVRSVMDVYL
jgi:glycosyltransferase involved in cell wall biosynthesis